MTEFDVVDLTTELVSVDTNRLEATRLALGLHVEYARQGRTVEATEIVETADTLYQFLANT